MNEAQKIKAYFDDLASGRRVHPDVLLYNCTTPLPAGVRGAINGILSRESGGDSNRKLVLKYLTGHTSSKDLTLGQWYALYCLVRPFRHPGEPWSADNPDFARSLGAILADLVRQPGQAEMALGLELEPVEPDPAMVDFVDRLDPAIAALGLPDCVQDRRG